MTPEWLMEHADKKINEIVIEYSHHDEINRPIVEHSFEQLQGKMSSFSFMMLAPDQIARRARSCWCAACFNQLGRATLEPKGRELICTSCSSPFPLPWHEMTVKDFGTGIGGRRKEAQDSGKTFALMLKPNGFFAVQVYCCLSEMRFVTSSFTSSYSVANGHRRPHLSHPAPTPPAPSLAHAGT
jgi:Zn finger protein HypA/HybF involved in hydrogenase expression